MSYTIRDDIVGEIHRRHSNAGFAADLREKAIGDADGVACGTSQEGFGVRARRPEEARTYTAERVASIVNRSEDGADG